METRDHKQVDLDIASLVGASAFRVPEQAKRNFETISRYVSASAVKTLAALLTDSPNPDQAVNLFERLVSSERIDSSHLFDSHPFLIHYAAAIFGNSYWLGETLIQNPDLLQSFAREKNLDRVLTADEVRESFARFRSRSFDTDISLLLARFKRRQYVRIMLRDVLGLATLAETTAEISALSDILIEEALRVCESNLHNRYGIPEHKDENGRLVETPFSVLSLGKLGGNELNYSSDVDLLYIYGDGEDAGTTSISAREFFIRLAQELTEVLSRFTSEGPVFRIDLRLRPQGHEGEPAVRLAHALNYYANTAHGWELQALLKTRHSAGNAALSRAFIRGTQPYVYKEELNFAAIKTALVSLQKIQNHHRRESNKASEKTLDVKLERGGIRDIEFLVQCLQRVYGGPEPWLRSGGTLFSLQKLHDKSHLSGRDFFRLNNAYVFLRRVEHRLQLRQGQQTHKLPSNPDELCALYRALMGSGTVCEPEALERLSRKHMDVVSTIYDRIVLQQNVVQVQEEEAAELQPQQNAIDVTGEQSYTEILSRLAVDSPELFEIASHAELGSTMRKNFFRFISAALTSAARYSTVLKHASHVRKALPIFAHSAYLTDVLVRHPDEIQHVGMPDDGSLSAADSYSRIFRLADRICELEDREAEIMALLRSEFRHAVFLVGSQDVINPRLVWSSLKHLTAAADAVIAATLAAASAPEGFAVFALGRLGACEFDVFSDADLIFVRDEAVDGQLALRVATRTVDLLSAYTKEGTTFIIDTRLRPHGSQGELVVTPSGLENYLVNEAHTWEALAFQKFRFVAGDPALADCARRCVSATVARFQQAASFSDELRAMRTRLESSAGRELDMKLSAGGVYDLDFIAGYCAIRCGVPIPAANILDRLSMLADLKILDRAVLEDLRPAAEYLRSLEHVVRLVDGRNRKSLPRSDAARASVEWFMPQVLGRPVDGTVASELRRWMQVVRTKYFAVLEN